MNGKNIDLIFEIEDYKKFLLIVGIKDFEISSYDDLHKELLKNTLMLEVQMVDTHKILNVDHIYFATLYALKAFKNRKNISKNLAMEMLLYISGQGQIKNAIKIFGLTKGKMNVALIVIGERKKDLDFFLISLKDKYDFKIKKSLIESSRKKIENIKLIFGISNLEIDASKRKGDTLENVLKKLIIERMALLYAGSRQN